MTRPSCATEFTAETGDPDLNAGSCSQGVDILLAWKEKQVYKSLCIKLFFVLLQSPRIGYVVFPSLN